MVFACPIFQHGVDVAAAIAALRGVIEAGGDLEFLDGVGIGNGGEGQLSTGEIGGRDPFDQVVVIGLSLAIHVDPCSAAAQVSGIVDIRRRARRKREQLLKILSRERQGGNRCSTERSEERRVGEEWRSRWSPYH